MVPSIAQLVERRTVEEMSVILRSLVRIRLEGNFFSLFFFSLFYFAINHIFFIYQNLFCILVEMYINYHCKKLFQNFFFRFRSVRELLKA